MLLEQHGFPFEQVPADVTEAAPEHLSPGEIVLLNARLKAQAVARDRPESVIIGVDTLVALDHEVLGKPGDFAEAESMLARLNGGEHNVYSGVWILQLSSGKQRGFTEITHVRFRRLSASDRTAYLRRINPLDKAGAYAAQEDNGELIESVAGSFSNVIGLPMERLKAELRSFSIVPAQAELTE